MMHKISFFFTTLFSFLFSFLQAEPIHLIWQVDKSKYYEADWIAEIFSGIPYTEHLDGHFSVFENDSVIVLTVHEPPFPDQIKSYFDEMDKRNYRYAIVHIEDELYGQTTEFYKNAQFVLRNYWHKKFLRDKNVVPFPIGYKVGFWHGRQNKQTPEASQRDYVWSFAGQIIQKPTRQEMIAQMKSIPCTYYIHETFAWADPKSLSIIDYRNLLLKTIFVPCPTGWWNLDSFRVYEALEAGCIPIVEKKPFDYFSKLFGRYPFLSVDRWEEAPDLINHLLADPVRLEQKRQQCLKWWLNQKKRLQKRVEHLCQKHLQS